MQTPAMNSSRYSIRVASALLLAIALGSALPAAADSPLAMLPVGKSASYHIVTQTDAPVLSGDSGSSNSYVRIIRTSVTAFGVQINGAPAGQITLNADGTSNVPPQLKHVLAPFAQVTLLMSGAPQPLAPGGSWAANVPIPLGDSTDIVPATISVSQLSSAGATILASGQNSTAVKGGLRSKPTTVSLMTTMQYNASKILTSANSKVVISVKAGALRTKDVTSTWSLTFSGP